MQAEMGMGEDPVVFATRIARKAERVNKQHGRSVVGDSPEVLLDHPAVPLYACGVRSRNLCGARSRNRCQQGCQLLNDRNIAVDNRLLLIKLFQKHSDVGQHSGGVNSIAGSASRGDITSQLF